MTDETKTPADEPFFNADVTKFVDEGKLINEIASYFEDVGTKILYGTGGVLIPNPTMAGHILAMAHMIREGTWRGLKDGSKES